MKGFTDKGVDKVKPGPSKKTITEGNGFYLQISPKGQKTWYHRYEIHGRRRWFKLGEYPAMSLKDARAENEKLLAQTSRGEDPAERRLRDPTVTEFFQQWVDEAKGPKGTPWSDQHRKNTFYTFKADVLPYIGHRKLRDVQKREIQALLNRIKQRAPNQALQVYRRLNRLFSYAAELDLIDVSPMFSLPPIGSQGVKTRHLSDEEVKLFLEALPRSDMAPNTAAILEIILRTGQRPTEVCGAMAKEIQGDWWTIPETRTKNRIEHRIFLTPKVKALFGQANEYGLFFPSLRDASRPVVHTILSKALRRSIQGEEKTQQDKTPSMQVAPFTPHDLRRTCATYLARLRFSDEVVGAVLNHKKQTVTGINYNQYQYDAEKQKALKAWHIGMSKLLAGEPFDVDEILGEI